MLRARPLRLPKGTPHRRHTGGLSLPDTYELLVDQATPEALVRRQLDTFTEHVLQRYRKYAEDTSKPLTLHQALSPCRRPSTRGRRAIPTRL